LLINNPKPPLLHIAASSLSKRHHQAVLFLQISLSHNSLSVKFCLCMAVSILSNEVSDLCLGKPALSSLSASATVGDALSALKRSGDLFLSVWSCDHLHHCNSPISIQVDFEECKCVGKVCLVDVICFLSVEENLKNPGKALQEPVSVLLNSKVPGLVRHLEPHARHVHSFLDFFFLSEI
jgi:hypothetical protein